MPLTIFRSSPLFTSFRQFYPALIRVLAAFLYIVPPAARASPGRGLPPRACLRSARRPSRRANMRVSPAEADSL